MTIPTTVFSEFEARKVGVKFGDATAATVFECIGSLSDEQTTRTVTKKCRGVVKKYKVTVTGGELTISGHWPYNVLTEIFNMVSTDYKTGTYTFGSDQAFAEGVITALVKDEDGNEKYHAWPKCVCTSGRKLDIENSGDDEEVPESELTFQYFPDDSGAVHYENFEADAKAIYTTAEKWLTDFDSAKMLASA